MARQLKDSFRKLSLDFARDDNTLKLLLDFVQKFSILTLNRSR